MLLGSGGAGKTALVQQYLNQYFPRKVCASNGWAVWLTGWEQYVPTALDEYWVPMHFNNRDIVLHIWDSAGQVTHIPIIYILPGDMWVLTPARYTYYPCNLCILYPGNRYPVLRLYTCSMLHLGSIHTLCASCMTLHG